MKPSIIVIGSSNVDLIMQVPHLPRPGETVTGGSFSQVFGGKGANQALAAALAGGNVTFVTCVGSDTYGSSIHANLARAGIRPDCIFTEQDVASGTAIILVSAEGENCIGIAPGANYQMSSRHIDQAEELIQAADLVVLQYEIPSDTLYYAIERAAQSGKRIMFNLAPALPFREDFLSRLDYLLVNEHEAESLVNFPLDSPAQVEHAAAELLTKGPRTVIITLGPAGAYVATQRERNLVPAFPVTAVDTTAAGDVFAGSLAVALVEGRSLLDGVRFASAAAAITVTRLGAQTSIPSRAEIEAFLADFQ